MAINLSLKAFEKALKELKNPKGQQANFLRIHAHARGQAMTMKRLAEEVGYGSWRGMNLQYGILARDIGLAAGLKRSELPHPNILLLVDFVPPAYRSSKNISNSEWILVMKEPFMKALKATGWI